MNSRSLMMIAFIGVIAVFAFIIAAMMGVGKLTERPLIRICVELADTHRIKEVSLAIVPPTGEARALRVSYETSVLHDTMDAQKEEAERIAKMAWEKVKLMEQGSLTRDERAKRGPIRKVDVRRTWRSERGCFKRSDESTYEWTPPPPTERR
jgi:hypothetical protein